MKMHRFPLFVFMMVCLLALAVSNTSQAQQDVLEKAQRMHFCVALGHLVIGESGKL